MTKASVLLSGAGECRDVGIHFFSPELPQNSPRIFPGGKVSSIHWVSMTDSLNNPEDNVKVSYSSMNKKKRESNY